MRNSSKWWNRGARSADMGFGGAVYSGELRRGLPFDSMNWDAPGYVGMEADQERGGRGR